MELNALPCRTCGNHFSIGQDTDQMKPIIAMVEILELLTELKLQVAAEDGLPQYMCNVCIAGFQNALKLKTISLEMQAKLVHMKSLDLNVTPMNKSSGKQCVLWAAATFQTAEPEKREPPIGPSLDIMEKDNLTEAKPKDWQCRICTRHFPHSQESRFKFHVKWHKLERRQKCPHCWFFCTSTAILNNHKRAAHPLSKCTICSKVIRRQLLHRHMNEHLKKRKQKNANKPSLLQQPAVSVSSAAPAIVSSPMIVAPDAALAASIQNSPPGPSETQETLS